MVLSLFRKKPDQTVVTALYRAVVSAARQPVFYAEWGVPDTVNGRFDMISLHAVLLFRRLRREGEDAVTLGQAVFDLFFKDMDRSLREMGVGDLSVPKKIQKMGELFYGLLAAVTGPMDSKDLSALRAAIARNLFEGAEVPGIDALCAYLMQQEISLSAQPLEAIRRGDIAFGTVD